MDEDARVAMCITLNEALALLYQCHDAHPQSLRLSKAIVKLIDVKKSLDTIYKEDKND